MKSTMMHRVKWFGMIYLTFFVLGLAILIGTDKRDFHYWLNGYYSNISDELFSWITWLGHGMIFIVVILVTGLKRYANIILGLAAFLLSSGLAQFMKKILFPGALRPVKYFENEGGLHFVEGVKLHSMHSFPSGHAASAFALALFITLVSKNERWGILWCFMALITAYSRVYLSQHFFEDILAGSIIGVFSTWLVFILWEKKLNTSKRLSKGLLKS